MATTKLTDDDIERKLEAITSLQRDWRWKVLVEVVNLYQYNEQMELFSKKFMELSPVQKDKEHAGIVRSLRALDFVKNMPQWLEKRTSKRWDKLNDPRFFKQIIQKGINDARKPG
jgi:hypothetical protein